VTPGEPRPRWSLVVELAKVQRGLVRRDQLVALGIPRGTIDEWVGRGLLHVVRRGVYAVGHPQLLPKAELLAAIWGCGPRAVLSHRSAAEEWELIEPRGPSAIQVTVPGNRRLGPPDIYIHRTNDLYPDETVERDGLPITSAARTVFDFASQASDREVGAAFERGLIEGFFDRDKMIQLAMRHRGRRGIKKIRRLIDRDAPPTVTIQEAHRRLLELIRSSGLPHPKTEVPIGPYRADILFPEAMLIVEMDSAKWHTTPGRIERDKRRDAELAAKGYLTLRVTWNDLKGHPAEVISLIAQTYALRTTQPARSLSTR
jgi:very-short-patch-repair endonuclease